MAYNDKKILQVLISELNKTPDRCQGYKGELKHLLAEVLNLEREHMIARTNVVVKIADQVNTVGMFLHKTRNASSNKENGEN